MSKALDFFRHLWPAPRPHRQEYRNTIPVEGTHFLRMARKWKTAEQEVSAVELRELERQSA